MNTYYITLSSNSISTFQTLSENLLQDNSVLNISLSAIVETYPPLYVNIVWGDGVENLYYNDPIKNYKHDVIFPEITDEKYSKIFSQRFMKEYKAPQNTLYKNLTATITIAYLPNVVSTFNIPIKIRKNDYFEDFGDVSLNNVRLLSNLSREYQFSAQKDDKLFEIKTPD